jgi:effector-binding domain-containing protein
MFKIGEFSKLSLVPVKTLRYYDEIGLVRPEHVDRFTGYRYYTAEQLPRINRVLAFKDLGFALEQVAQLLDGDLSPEHMRAILAMKQAELERRVQDEQERLARVAWRLSQIQQEGTMPTHEMVIKQVEPQLVAAVRDTVPHYPDVGRLINEVYAHLGRAGAHGTTCAVVYHDGEYREQDVDAEGVVFLEKPVAAGERVKIYELPAATVASTVHHGGYSGLTGAYRELMGWISASGYTIVGPEREIYHRGPATPGDQNDADCVTEIQFPVEKAA